MRNAITLPVLVFIFATLFFSTLPAQAASAVFSAGTKAFTEGDYSKALADFQKARDSGVEGPAVHYNIAVCQYRLGNYPQAAAEFRLIAERYPKMRALAEYNIGLALLHENRRTEARREFERARESSTDEKVTQLAEAMLRRTAPRRELAQNTPKWVSLVDFNAGHDDNVALLDSSSLPAGQSAGSAFTELLAVVSGPLSSGPGLRFNGGIYAVRYPDASAFNQTATRLGGAYQWTAGHWRMQAETHFSESTLDGSAFEHRLGAGIGLKRLLSRTTAIGLSLVRDQISSGSSQFAFVKGSREQLGWSWDRYGKSGRLTLAYRLESNSRASPTVSPTRNGVSIRYRYSMSRTWDSDLSLSLRRSAYSDPTVARNEDRTQLRLGVRRRFSGSWLLIGTFLWSDNRSNVPAFAYTRDRVSVGVTKDF